MIEGRHPSGEVPGGFSLLHTIRRLLYIGAYDVTYSLFVVCETCA